jgi:hypothetical protein
MLHPLVNKTRLELIRLDKITNLSWDDQKEYNSKFLPISTSKKLRKRALAFMDRLIKKLESDGGSIQFKYKSCHFEMYGQSIEINLRQKYKRVRVKGNYGYSRETYEETDKLEFQVGSYARKNWIDRKTKSLEDYFEVIYNYIERDCREWADLRLRQEEERKEREKREALEKEIALKAQEEEQKLNMLFTDAENYQKAQKIREYINTYKRKVLSKSQNNLENLEYVEWALGKAQELDPLSKFQETK